MTHENTPGQALYDLDVEDLAQVQAPVLVHTLRGSLDAGGVGDLVARHLLDSLPARRVATFDADELIDYRSRRPAMEFENFEYTAYHEPAIAIDLLRDDEGRPLLLLHGAEPDLRWEAFVSELTELVERLGVERTIGVHGFPGPVPHTRPSPITSHGAVIDKAGEQRAMMVGTVQVPGTASGLLEYRLNQQGRPATGISVTVPHYLVQNEFPQAAAAAVRWIARAAGLSLPVGELEAAATEVDAQIAAQVGQSPEIAAVVEGLEKQYDQYAEVARGAGEAARDGRSLTASASEIPSADEIGAEAEAFLAGQSADGETDGAAGGEADGAAGGEPVGETEMPAPGEPGQPGQPGPGAPAEPGPSQPGPSQPGPAQPGPIEPGPTDPTQPGPSPSTPGRPDTPPEPSQPSEPTGPGTPDTPMEPVRPDAPTEPPVPGGSIGVPSEPPEPSAPPVPSEPSAPPVPSEPSAPPVPTSPDEPAGPVTPADPTAPGAPEPPAQPDQPGRSDPGLRAEGGAAPERDDHRGLGRLRWPWRR